MPAPDRAAQGNVEACQSGNAGEKKVVDHSEQLPSTVGQVLCTRQRITAPPAIGAPAHQFGRLKSFVLPIAPICRLA